MAHTPSLNATPDANLVVNPAGPPLAAGQYDNELLDAHYITGDGRGNENIGLTTVHHVFHSEHNRQVDSIKQQVIDDFNLNGLTSTITGYLLPTANTGNGIQDSDFDGARLFQAARFATEMQYQHLVFEEFARKINPAINLFTGYATAVDPSIVAEFAHTVFRFGHSMLTNTIDRINPDGSHNDIGLIPAFLNPLEFAASGTDAGATGVGIGDAAAGAIIRGLTQQVGNEIDEFVVDSVRNNLLGLPLDLPAINIARGRDTGVPSLNSARRTFFEATNQESALKPYESWSEFGLALRHAESLVNFVAAYGRHASITDTMTLQEKRDAAYLLVHGNSDVDGDGILDIAPVDRVDFMNGTGSYVNLNGITVTGLDEVDFWMGGLAERPAPFGGMLGSTFGFVFEVTMTNLQDGDRFYYLSRTLGLNFLHQLEANSFSELIMRNTTGVGHLAADSFSTPTFIFEAANLGTFGPVLDDTATPYNESTLLIRTQDGTLIYTGGEHVVMGGTAGNDKLTGGEGDDSLWGDAGNDRLEGGAGNDHILGGAGNDILTDSFGDDVVKGGDGHDVINAGPGLDLILMGAGSDFAVSGNNESEFFAGSGNDFVLGGSSANIVFGNEGDDWIEGGDGADLLQGDNGDPFQASSVTGDDVIIGGGGNDDYDAESGDDIMVAGQGVERNEGMLGFDWTTYRGDNSNGVGVGHNADMLLIGAVPPTVEDTRDRFDLVEGLSGWDNNDTLSGDNLNNAAAGVLGHALTNMALIDGLQGLLDGMRGAGQTVFDSGNIILGGGGNDLIEGRGGNDLIDGDKWLNVRLAWVDSNNVERSADSMTDPALQAALFSGQINPSQVRIVREIITAAAPGADTAIYNDAATNYSVIHSDGPGGTGTWTVVDLQPLVAGIGGAGLPLGPIDEGTDRLRNVEQLRFMLDTNADGISDGFVFVNLAENQANVAAAGSVTISNATPAEDVVLTVSSLLTDVNGSVNLASIQYNWQAETSPGVWTTVLSNSSTFTPGNGQVNLSLRVVADFEDNLGYREQRISAATAPVSNVNDAPLAADGAVVTVEDTPYTFSSTDFRFADADAGDSLSEITIDTVSGLGALTFNGNPVAGGQVITTGNIGLLSFAPTLNGNGPNHGSFTFRVADQSGAYSANANTLHINVTPVNDAPQGTDNTITIAEDAFHTFSAADFGFTDVDAGDAMRAVQIISPPAGLALSGNQVNTGDIILVTTIGNLTYTPLANANGVGHAGFTFAVRDLSSVQDSTPATMTVNVTAVNDAPTGTPVISDTTPTEGGTVTASILGIGDVDGLTGATFNYQWQASSNGTTWNPVGTNSAGFTPGQTQVNQHLRVVATYTDDNGTAETVTSAATTVVGDLYTGNNQGNVKVLTNGEDVANGLGGADVLIGLGGNDVLNGGNGADVLDGGDGSDLLDGGAAADTLLGGADNDVLLGGAAADILIGGTGADQMSGGDGNDLYDVDDVGDQVIELAAQGTDTVETTLTSYSLAGLANVEHLTFTGVDPVAFTGTGNALVNIITGGDGGDFLDGQGGNDNMIGGLGDDTYFVTQQGEVTELAGEGTDTVVSGVTYTIAALPNIENITLSGVGVINATGNTGNNVLIGNTSANVLTGGDGQDTLIGGGGLDTLNGGADADSMTGGADNDSYEVNHVGDTVIESVGASGGVADLIRTTFTTFSLAVHAGIENLTFQPVGSTVTFVGTGNSLGNVITGQAGADFLDGAGGADQMIGGQGGDTYFVDNTSDLTTEAGSGTGIDQVFATANTYTLGGNVENLTFIGAGGFNGTGNASNNVIIGGSQADNLNGGNGTDTLIGGLGDDAMNGGGNADIFVFNGTGFGLDTIAAFDFDPLGAGNAAGQDILQILGLGLSAADVGTTAASRVFVSAGLGVTTIVVDSDLLTAGIDGTINLTGVLAANITEADFLFA